MNSTLYIRILGGFFILVGLLVRFSLWKSWFWRSRGGAYAYIPMGIVFILYTFIPEMNAQDAILYYGYIAVFLLFIALTVYFSLKPPAWMKPKWVSWIEKYPKNVVNAMKDAAIKGNLDWKGHIDSEEEVDKLAKKFRSK